MTDDENKKRTEVINLLLFAPLEFSLLSFPARATTSAIYIEEQLNRSSQVFMVNANGNNNIVIFINSIARVVAIALRHDDTHLALQVDEVSVTLSAGTWSTPTMATIATLRLIRQK